MITWLQITSGQGPAECEQAVVHVLQALVVEAAAAGVQATTLDAVQGSKPGLLQSVLIDEIKVEVMRSSGPGGQHANKTESAVRVTHLPTGKSAIAREERSQHRNRALALARLAQVLEDEAQKQVALSKQVRRQQHQELERGNPIRTYQGITFQPQPH